MRGMPVSTLLLLLVALATVPPAVQHTTESRAAPGSTPAETPKETPAPPPAKTMQQFWTESVASFYCPEPSRKEPLWLIVTLPDPLATSVPAAFDEVLDSLVRAAAAGGWVYDRAWLPWSAKPAESKERRMTLAASEPGMLLFREASAAGGACERLLGVMLVGETPTSGINREALLSAIRYLWSRKEKKVRILGPRFSGSISALRACLRQIHAEEISLSYDIVTASATNPNNQTALDELGASGIKLRYRSAILDDKVVGDRFLEWLKKRGIHPDRTAVLVEAGTAFGAGFKQQTPDPNEPLVVEFPYQIGRLRDAYQDDPELRALGAEADRKASKQGLDLTLKSEKAGSDRLPAFAGRQTTLAQELELRRLFRALEDLQVEAAGISATDPLDTVFLVQYLRRLLPDIRLFVYDSDLMFTYSGPAVSFEGFLMVSPVPLWNRARMRQWRDSRFVSVSANRSMDATREAFAMLTRDAPARESREVWVTAVGRGQSWPLTGGPVPSAVETLRPSWPFHILMYALAASAFWGGWIYWGRRHALRKGAPPAASFLLFELPESGPRAQWMRAASGFGLVCSAPAVWALREIIGAHPATAIPAIFAWLVCLSVFIGGFIEDTGRRALLCGAMWAAGIGGLLAAAIPGEWFGAPDQYQLALHRMTAPESGVSPWTPWVFAFLGIAWLGIIRLRMLRNRELRSPRLEGWPADDPLLRPLDQQVRRVTHRTESPLPFREIVIAAIWATLMVVLFGFRPLGTIEPSNLWPWVISGGLLGLSACIVASGVRFFEVYRCLEELLHTLRDHPLATAFTRLPADLAPSQLWLHGTNRFPLQSTIQAIRILQRMEPDLLAANVVQPKEVAGIEAQAAALLHSNAQHQMLESSKVDQLHESICIIHEKVYQLLAGGWHGTPCEFQKDGEDLCAIRLATFARYVVLQLRALLEYCAIGLICLIAAAISYPFDPSRRIIWVSSGLTFAIGFAAIYVFLHLDGHPILAALRASGRKSEGSEFWKRIATFGAAPVLAAVTALFPGSARYLGTLMDHLSKLLGV